MMVLLVHSKSKAWISASRSVEFLNFSRRVLMNQPCAPDGVSSGRIACLTRPSLMRGKIVARRPDARGEFLAEQIALGGEALEARRRGRDSIRSARCRNCSARARPAGRRPTSPSRARIRCSARTRSARPCRGRSRAARRASSRRNCASNNRRARRSAGRRRTAARRARASARTAAPRSRRPSASAPTKIARELA